MGGTAEARLRPERRRVLCFSRGRLVFGGAMANTDLKTLADRAVAEIGAAADEAALEAARVRYLGRKDGALAEFTKQIPALPARSEEHTSELQSPMYLVCRLLLEKKK